MPVFQSEKRSVGAEVLVAGVVQTSDPWRPGLEALPNLSLNVTYQIRCALRALNEVALLATIWNLSRRAINIRFGYKNIPV